MWKRSHEGVHLHLPMVLHLPWNIFQNPRSAFKNTHTYCGLISLYPDISPSSRHPLTLSPHWYFLGLMLSPFNICVVSSLTQFRILMIFPPLGADLDQVILSNIITILYHLG